MAAAYVNSGQEATASGNSLGFLITWAQNLGDTLSLWLRVGSTTATAAVADSLNGSWGAAILTQQQTSDGHTAYVFKFPNCAAALANATTVTVTLTGGPASIRYALIEDSGTTGVLDGSTSTQGTSTAPASGTVAMGNAGDILRGFITQNGAVALTSPGFAGSPGGAVNTRQSISTFLTVFDIVVPGTTGSYGSIGSQASSQAWTASVLGFLPGATAVSGSAAITEGSDTAAGAGFGVAFPAGYVTANLQTTAYAGSGYSLQQLASPAVSIGADTFAATRTLPGNYLVQINADGTVVVLSGADNSRQSFQVLLYRSGSATFDGPGTVWVNEVPPIWASPVVLPTLQLGVAITPINLNAYVVSTEGDALSFSIAAGGLPDGLTLNSPLITGTPTSNIGQGNTQSFPIAFFAVDSAGSVGTTQSPGTSFTVNGQAVPFDNIRVRTPRARSRTLRTGARPQVVPDWQSLSKMEAQKVRRIDRKLRALRNAPPAAREQALEEELHAAPPASAAYHPKPMPVGPLPHTDDQDIARILADEHRQLMALASHVLKVIGS